MRNVEYATVAKLVASKGVASKMENILQVLWFGGNLEYNDGEDGTALSYSATYGDLASLNILLEYGAKSNVCGQNRWTPLHKAIKYGTVEMVQALLNAKANIEAKTAMGSTPLHIACQRLDKEKVTVLLNAGANVMAKTKYGDDAVTITLNENASAEKIQAIRALLQAAVEKTKANY